MKEEWKQTRLAAGALTAALLLTSGALAAEHGTLPGKAVSTETAAAIEEPSVSAEKVAEAPAVETAAAPDAAAELAEETVSQETDGQEVVAPAEEAAMEENIAQEAAVSETPTSQQFDIAEKAQPYIQPAAQRAEDWRLLLVNPWNTLPEDYEMELSTLSNGLKVDARIDEDLEAMLTACREAGLRPIVCSAYRTQETQVRLYNNKIARLRAAGWDESTLLAEAARWVAPPGTSEHQTGLALDIVSAAYQLLDDAQADTAEQQWLMEHCWEYGFILRYPEDKTEITGIGYEPWHYRYVGRETAAAIRESGLCLEEYLQTLPLPTVEVETADPEETPAEETGVPVEAVQEPSVTENVEQEVADSEAAGPEVDSEEGQETDSILVEEAIPGEAALAQADE